MEESKMELVEQYLDGLLSGDELADFEDQLEIDTTLRSLLQYVQLERQLMTAIRSDKQTKQIKSWNKAYHRKRKIRIGLGVLLLVIIAVATLIWGFGSSTVKKTPIQNTAIALYIPPEDYRPMDQEVRTKIGDLVQKDLKEEGLDDLSKLNNLAHELFKEGRYDEAKEIFFSLKDHHILGLKAEWNGVLCDYAQQNHPDTITPALQTVLDNKGHLYNPSAQKLRDVLAE